MKPLRIVFFGDSFVNGTGDPDCLGWAGRLAAASRRRGHDVTYYNCGIRRETSADIAARWKAEARCRLPESDDFAGRLVFSFGVNDCIVENGAPRIAPADSLTHARAILTQAAAWTPILFIGPPPIADAEVNARLRALSAGLETLCQELAVPFLDTVTPLAASPLWMEQVGLVDGAHPGAPGYALLAEMIAAWEGWQGWF